MKILIVNDNKAMQKILAKSMVSLGFQNENFSYADNDDEAIDKTRSQQPDLVLLDLQKNDQSLRALVSKLCEVADNTKSILLSTGDDTQLKQRAHTMGVNGYLKKPFTAAQLFSVVNDVMGTEARKNVTILESKLHWSLPGISVIERMLSSLHAVDITISQGQYQNIDYSNGPFCGGTLMDDVHNVVLAVFLDVDAANLMAAVLRRQSVFESVSAAGQAVVNEPARQAVKSFVGMLSAVCRPLNSERLLELHAEQYAEDASRHLKHHLDEVADDIQVWIISNEAGLAGNILLVKSPHIS